MPVTQIDTNQWLVEFDDHLTRQDGTTNHTVQIVAEITPEGIHLRPWRILHFSPAGHTASPIPNTEAVWQAYRPLAILELFSPLVLSSHRPYGVVESKADPASASLENLLARMRSRA